MKVKGTDVVFYVDDSGTLTPVACARTASLTTAADIGETSTLGTGKWKTFKGLKMSFTVSCAGLVSFDMNMSIAKLRQLQADLLPVGFAFYGSSGGNEEKYDGNILITDISTPTSYDGKFEYSLEGQGTGELTITIV